MGIPNKGSALGVATEMVVLGLMVEAAAGNHGFRRGSLKLVSDIQSRIHVQEVSGYHRKWSEFEGWKQL